MGNILNINASNPLPLSLGGTGNTSGTATNATNGATVGVGANATYYPLFAASSSNSNQPFNLNTTLNFNPNTGNLNATTFTGALVGNASTVTTNANLTGPITSVGNATTVTAASITNSMLAGSIDLTSKVTNNLPFANGGFGFSTATLGDIFYASGTNTPGKLADVAVNQVLVSGGVGAAPAYSSIPTLSTLTLTSTGATTFLVNNNAAFYAKNSGGTSELYLIPRWTDNATYLNYGSAGFNIRNNSGTNAMTLSNALNVDIVSGNLLIDSPTSGITQKGSAVSAGVANGSFNTGVVLVAGTVTISNSYVTTSCAAAVTVSTTGGTPSLFGYRVVVGAGTYTVTGAALDTSTLNVHFTKGN